MSIWSQASQLAAQTPENRNRYVDFLRALSIMFVISGHWLITTGHYLPASGDIQPILALEVMPWTQWLTWGFQVMPIFFIVGGYSNAISLESAQRKQLSYAQWLATRLHRLLTPLLLLVLFWVLLSFGLGMSSAKPETIRFLSRAALVPTWFLAIYTMIVLLAPAAHRLWRRWGMPSLFGFIALAALTDIAFFVLDWRWAGWTNYFWVWLAMHHLGFAWRDGRLGGTLAMLGLAALGLAALVALIFIGPYPLAMAGSPGEAVSNTLPPKVTLVALGLFQFGLLMAIEKPLQRWLSRLRVWTACVLVNSMIMTIYLWHMTVLLVVLAAGWFLDGFGFHTAPGGADWWATRPVWLALLTVLLVPLALLLSPLERVSRPADAPLPAAWRLVGGAILAGAGITLATLLGFDGAVASLKTTGTIALILGGGWLAGLAPPLPKRG
ncbi:acyltransferase family protein [Mangrovimicrobium sediminis]|nr:acyltransferase [Haliea sp. SAOS-164]